MPSHSNYLRNLPPEQQRLRDRCYHPSGMFIPFPAEAIEQSIPERFAEIARLYPDRPAVQDTHTALTYAELHRRAHRVAAAIIAEHGTEPEPVALFFQQSVPCLIAMLGVLKAGKFYVPLDATHPLPRLRLILQDSQSRVILTDQTHLSIVEALAPQGQRIINVETLQDASVVHTPGPEILPSQFACIIYTSGSTGQPKGVIQTHRNLLYQAMTYAQTVHVCPEDRLAFPFSHSGVGATWMSLSTLLNGAAYVHYDLRNDGLTMLGPWLARQSVTILSAFPQAFFYFASALTEHAAFPGLRLIHLGGEPVYARAFDVYRQRFASDCLVLNQFGTTETGMTHFFFADKDTPVSHGTLPVGYGCWGSETFLLDAHQQPVGGHQAGEIAIQGRYLSPGYWNLPALTGQKFMRVQQEREERLYLSGDLGITGSDGCLLHLGRKDLQVKIRGYRVEPAEVEDALLRLAGVQQAVVVSQTSPLGEPQLVGYVVPGQAAPPDTNELRQSLGTMLPEYMIPSAFVMLDALPLMPNGKVDRRLLPTPQQTSAERHAPPVAPRTPAEEVLARLWCEVLGRPRISVHDRFLELGGHSLLATKLLSRVIETFQIDLPLRSLMETPTIAEMAVVITQHRIARAAPDTVPHLLAEVEAMAAEEVQRHLANERHADP